VSAHAIGVDVGGTKIAAMRVSENGRVQERRVVRSPAEDAGAMLTDIASVAGELRTEDVRAVGLGVAALIDRDGIVRYGPNIAWRDVALGARLSDALGLPCLVENDANVAAWGEFRLGAGREAHEMLLVTVGTGIGGGIIADGRLVRGAHGFAAEIGHIIVEPGGPLCGCGNRGCWEQVASGRAIQRAAKQAVLDHPDSFFASMAGGNPARADGPMVTRAAREGDAVARGILDEVGRRLGEGIAGLVNVLDPELVVVGGGAVEAGDLLLEPARARFTESVEGPGFRPDVPIIPAELGNDAGGVGAALLALEELGA
jgi:glucokinase